MLFVPVFCLVAGTALAGPSAAHADPPDFATDQVANFTALIIADQLNREFQADPTFVGTQVLSSGLEISFASAATDVQRSAITVIENAEAATLSADPASPSNPPNVPITVRTVPNSLADLTGVGKSIATDRAKWNDAGIVVTAWGPDIASDTLMVWLATYSDQAARQLENAYGPMLSVSTQGITAEGSSRTADSQPWWGGDKIDNGSTLHVMVLRDELSGA